MESETTKLRIGNEIELTPAILKCLRTKITEASAVGANS
jgi:hypothetical protein